MLFGDKILKYKDELLADLNTLIGIQSVDGKRNDECDRALRFIIKRASDFGLISERVTDKSAHVELGGSGKLCGVLSHLDIVPAGSNWSVSPYALTQKDGRIYGRGVADDKGAALVNLYCLRALKEEELRAKIHCVQFTAPQRKRGWTIWTAILKECRSPIWLLRPTASTEFAVPKRESFIYRSAPNATTQKHFLSFIRAMR